MGYKLRFPVCMYGNINLQCPIFHLPPALICASGVSLLAIVVQVPLDLLCGLSHKLARFLVFRPVLYLTFSEKYKTKQSDEQHQ